MVCQVRHVGKEGAMPSRFELSQPNKLDMTCKVRYVGKEGAILSRYELSQLYKLEDLEYAQMYFFIKGQVTNYDNSAQHLNPPLCPPVDESCTSYMSLHLAVFTSGMQILPQKFTAPLLAELFGEILTFPNNREGGGQCKLELHPIPGKSNTQNGLNLQLDWN
eukprot:TRINITY_DN27569_c0_g2_i1.p1 TRINITY_DN27569_c0_g2~~TRINITY_DN27569_c0_g2_i1.p1  ORF type:complete len:163 (-),score=12.67 TRINITY_DN27569_c0_g2_i1:99-587(-)